MDQLKFQLTIISIITSQSIHTHIQTLQQQNQHNLKKHKGKFGNYQIQNQYMLTLLRRNYSFVYNMAHTARKQSDKIEHFDNPEVLEKKIDQLVEMIRKSNHFISFTGAGISTSTGIPDFRSGKDTVLPTGPGAWEKKALGLNTQPKLYTPTTKAKPSLTHMSLVTLQQYGVLKYLVSQNTDGLHLRSGFPTDFLSELHGNINLEECRTCSRKFLRDYRTRSANGVFDHETNRKCEVCEGKLYDTIINFGEKLPQDVLEYAFNHGQCADLCLALGSSLTVNPAAEIPHIVGKNANLVIVNLQSTPLDGVAALRINAMCDDVMKRVMEKLEIPIQRFTLKRYIQIKRVGDGVTHLRGIDPIGTPYSFLKSITSKNDNIKFQNNREPFIIFTKPNKSNEHVMDIDLVFYKHYNQPTFNITLNLEQIPEYSTYQLEYDVYEEKWLGITQHEVNFGAIM